MRVDCLNVGFFNTMDVAKETSFERDGPEPAYGLVASATEMKRLPDPDRTAAICSTPAVGMVGSGALRSLSQPGAINPRRKVDRK